MKKIVYKSNDRGKADYGWLKANYSFSFANYYNAERLNFGALRVLNDDSIQAGMGFGTHPHDNMEIITIPLKGALKHKDSMSNKWVVLNTGEVQVMSAGTGIMHSEMNNSLNEEVQLFQIWIFPSKEGITPKYAQQKFEISKRSNKLQKLVTSVEDDEEGTLKIHQNAQISRIDLEANKKFNYTLKSHNHGVYLMVISGEIVIEGLILGKRDAGGIYETKEISIQSNSLSELLFIEVPMKF